jgi:segregation and condensation protein B
MWKVNNLTNIIEGIVFASGEAVQVKYIVEKLGCSLKQVNASIDELKNKYTEESGIQLLTFNGKLQFASNPKYKEEISSVLTPIKEKEFTRTILECAALIAYKQPVTKGELEEIRQVSCDYAIHTLLELDMIVPCGRKDAIGKPILYCTTDNFLKRFKLNSIDELPDYDELMAQIAEINSSILDEEDSDYLYKKDEYVEENDAENNTDGEKPSDEQNNSAPKTTENGYEIPEFLNAEDDLIKIE